MILGKQEEEHRKRKAEIVSISNEIKAKKNGRELSALKDEERKELCKLYTSLAQKIDLVLPNEENEKEREEYIKTKKICMDKAKALGSVIALEIPKTTFEDIKGLDEVKELAKSFIFMVKNKKILQDYHMEGGLGLLMYGAPGTGKTMFAEAIAHEMNLPLSIITPASIFNSHVGESEKSVREIFSQIEACPDGAILFIDECESIFGTRGADTPDWKASVTTELLQRLNGFGVDGSKRVLIGATNRPDLIDIAFLRYKRFTHQIHIQPPDETAKRALIESAIKKIHVDGKDSPLDGITIDEIVDMCSGKATRQTPLGPVTEVVGHYSAADIRGIIEEVCRMAIEEIQKNGGTKAIPLRRDMFIKAVAKIPPSISQDLLDKYKNFRKADNGKKL